MGKPDAAFRVVDRLAAFASLKQLQAVLRLVMRQRSSSDRVYQSPAAREVLLPCTSLSETWFSRFWRLW